MADIHLVTRLRNTLRPLRTPDAVRQAVHLGIASGMTPCVAWTTAAHNARVHDAALIRECCKHATAGEVILGAAPWVHAPGALDALVELIEHALIAPESDCQDAAAIAVTKLYGRFTRAAYPAVVARLVETLRQQGPEPGRIARRTLNLASALAGLHDVGPELLEELDEYFRAAPSPVGRHAVATHREADCEVWAAQLEQPDDTVLLLIGAELERGQRVAGRHDERPWSGGAPHRTVDCRCDIVRRAEDMAIAGFPVALPPYCRRATGDRFRAVFVALAEAYAEVAVKVLEQATAAQRSALQPGDLTAILASSNPTMRLRVLQLLHEVTVKPDEAAAH